MFSTVDKTASPERALPLVSTVQNRKASYSGKITNVFLTSTLKVIDECLKHTNKIIFCDFTIYKINGM